MLHCLSSATLARAWPHIRPTFKGEAANLRLSRLRLQRQQQLRQCRDCRVVKRQRGRQRVRAEGRGQLVAQVDGAQRVQPGLQTKGLPLISAARHDCVQMVNAACLSSISCKQHEIDGLKHGAVDVYHAAMPHKCKR